MIGGKNLLIIPVILLLLFQGSCRQVPMENERYLDGEFWRKQGLEEIIPFWQANLRDTIHGAYFLNLTRDGKPVPPWDKHPAMISRHVFGFTAAYLLSGEEKYLQTAGEGVDYLLKYAWDKHYGGWYDMLNEEGNPVQKTKTVPNQLYTNVGLSLYYFATGDSAVLSKIKESVAIHKNAFDKVNGGYFQALSEDLTVSDSSKSKHGHYGYTSSLLINMILFLRDKELQSFAEELTEISFSHLRDPEYGWFLGFPVPHRTDWSYTPRIINNKEVISAGGQLTAALSLLRLSEITGNSKYRETGIDLGQKLNSFAWDSVRGGWFDMIEKMPPNKVQDTSKVYWWLQSYGLFLQLHLFNVTGNEKYLDYYKKMAEFWDVSFIDREYGGAYMSVLPDGSPVPGNKALAWKASYHEMENSILNYLYLNLYVNRKPASLYFHLSKNRTGKIHYVSLAENPSIRITKVKINGKPWTSFSAVDQSVTLPDVDDIKMEVELSPARQDR